MKQASIIFTHYSEDADRWSLAKRSLESLQQFRTDDIELIISANGIYGDFFKLYADKYIEREVDLKPGKSINDGIKVADSNIFIIIANDIVLYSKAIQACIELVWKYPKYLVTPVYPRNRKHHELPSVDGYPVNQRLGSGCLCITRAQYEDIGPFDEVMVNFDFINYMNRWIEKGYAVMGTKEPMGRDIGQGVHSYNKQMKEYGYKIYKSKKVRDPSKINFYEHK